MAKAVTQKRAVTRRGTPRVPAVLDHEPAQSRVVGLYREPDTGAPEADAPDETALTALLSTLHGDDDSKVSVFQVIDAAGRRMPKPVWLFHCSPQDFMSNGWAEIQNEYGAGSYNVRVYGRDPSGQTNYYVCLSNETWPIGAPRKSSQPAATLAAPAAQVNIAEQIAAALRPIMDAQSAMLNAIVQGANNRTQTLEEFKMLASILRPTGELAVVAPPKDSLGELEKLMGTLQRIRELMPESDSAPADAVTVAVKEGIGVVGQFIDAWKTQAASAPAPVALPAPAAPAQQQSNLAPQSQSAAPPGGAEDMNLREMQRMLNKLAVLIDAAANGEEPDGYAEMVYQTVPDDVLEEMKTNPQWHAKLAAFKPDVGKYPEWFAKLGALVLEIDREESVNDEPDRLAAPPGGGQ